MSFGENLISLRESKGISRQELANLLEIPYTTLRNYETDQREPGHKVLIKIAHILHVSVDSLIGNIENTPAPAEPETGESALLQQVIDCFNWLNAEGQERLAETADDMVQSGKYIKSNTGKMAENA